MPGELWRERVQIGKELTLGIGAAATRVAYLRNVSLTRERSSNPWRFATGGRDNQRVHTQGSVEAGGSVELPVSANELIEWLLITLNGGVTPTTPGGAVNARLWDFRPGTALDSLTLERNNGARIERATGVQGTRLQIAGEVGGENIATIDLFATEREDDFGALTTGLAERVPTFLEGWQTRIYLDALGATPGTTEITDLLHTWQVTVDNQLERFYTAQNSLSSQGNNIGELDITAELLFRAGAAQALTELLNWDNNVQRLLRLEFQDERSTPLDAGTNEVQTLTITGTPTGGTYTLSYTGPVNHPITAQVTAPIPFNATAAQVQAALRALPAIRSNVTCAGGPHPGTPITATFNNNLGGRNIAQMTATGSFTGGTSPAIAVTTTTPGTEAFRPSVIIDVPGAWMTPDTNQDNASARAYRFPMTYLYDPTNAFGIRFLLQNNRATAWT